MSRFQSIHTEFDKPVTLDGYALVLHPLVGDRSAASITVNTVKSETRLFTDEMSRREITPETNNIIDEVAHLLRQDGHIDAHANASNTSPDSTERSSIDHPFSILTALSSSIQSRIDESS